MAKFSGAATVTFTIGGIEYIGVMENAEVEVNNDLESVEGINQIWRENIVIGRDWNCSSDMDVDDGVPPLIVAAASNDVEGAFVLNTGAVLLVGTVLIKRARIKVGKRAKQTVSADLEGQGDLIASAVA